MLLEAFYQTLLDDLNYFNVMVLMAIESSVIPLPSEIVVPPAAYMAAEGRLNMSLVALFATIGSLIGATANYVVAFYVGRPIVYKFVNSRLGHLRLLSQEKMEQAERYFDKRGAVATLLGRLIPAIRQIISVPAGLAKMHFGYFILYTAIGAGLWNVVLCFLGWYLHKLVPMNQLDAMVHQYERPIIVSILLIVALVIVYFIWQARRSPKQGEK